MVLKVTKNTTNSSEAPPTVADNIEVLDAVVTAETDIPVASAKKGLGMFVNARPSSASDAPVTAATSKEGKRGIFSGFAKGKTVKAAASKADKPEKTAKVAKEKVRKEKPAKSPRKSLFSRSSVSAVGKAGLQVLVELEDGRQVGWRLDAHGLHQQELDVSSRVLSFSNRDLRFATDGAVGASSAQSLALSEVGEDVRVVNASRALNAVFAVTVERSKGFLDRQVGPGLLVLEEALKESLVPGEDHIGGVHLNNADGSIGLVVLYHFTSSGDVGKAQVTVNPDDLQFVLAQFVSARRLDLDTTKLTLLSNEDLLKASKHFRPYPTQASILGVPVSKVLNTGATLALFAAVGAGAYAATGYAQLESAKRQLSIAQTKKNNALREANEILTSSVVSFARTQAIGLDKAMGTARDVFVPGAVVQMDANTKRSLYTIRMPMLRAGTSGGRPSALDRTEGSHLQNLIDLAAPEGCEKSILNFTGALNVAQVTVECQDDSGLLLAYRLD